MESVFYYLQASLFFLFFVANYFWLSSQSFIAEPFRLCNTPYDEQAPDHLS